MFGQKDNITAALSAAYKSMYEKKEVTREKWVPESTAKAIDEAEVDVCEECGKVHEGACESGDKDKEESKVNEAAGIAEASEAEDYTPAYDDENEDDELVPRAEGESAFYNAHVEAGEMFDAQDIIDATFDTIKKSGPIKA